MQTLELELENRDWSAAERKHVYIRFFSFTDVDEYINSFIEVFLGFHMNGMSIFDIWVDNKFYKISAGEKVCGGELVVLVCCSVLVRTVW